MGIKEVHEGCIVRDNDDPQKRGRLIVECPTIVTGESIGDWMEPSFAFVDSVNNCGMFFIPSVGSIVSVEIESGSEAQANGLMPKWRCDVYPTDTVPEEFQENYPDRRGVATRSGHIFYFDDTDNTRELYYRHPQGTEIYVDNDGNTIIENDHDDSIYLGSATAIYHAVLGEAYFEHMRALIQALLNYASNPYVAQVPGVQAACADLVTACSAYLEAYPDDLSKKVLLE
jgi:hypothetical protein